MEENRPDNGRVYDEAGLAVVLLEKGQMLEWYVLLGVGGLGGRMESDRSALMASEVWSWELGGVGGEKWLWGLDGERAG